MHWVDMEWLWGYGVLPGSVRDMLAYCEATGAKGNVNFDGIGYEKLATEDPEAFALLREAVQSGQLEIVGGSYGQPYGLFHGGESNIRQRVYGVRTCLRLFGIRPVTFWEEEFDFFPQLPQILAGCGYRNASLFFQWTWHTPEIPFEDSPAIWWEGQDGTRLLTATRNKLNLHQWPEDIDAIFDCGLGISDSKERDRPSSLDPRPSSLVPLIQQWVELMPSPDWMCRSEVLIPPMKKLLADDRFEFRFQTLGEYLDSVRKSDAIPVRNYSMDDVWHGMSLGKNGDSMRRLSREAEATLLSAETLAAVAALFGRPYAQWDAYPTWELEESWRELLSAQHHDNDECEGLCGHVGRFSYERSIELSSHVGRANLRGLVCKIGGSKSSPSHFSSSGLTRTSLSGTNVDGILDDFGTKPDVALFVNTLGWPRRHEMGQGFIPGMGYAIHSAPLSKNPPTKRNSEGNLVIGETTIQFDGATAGVHQITSDSFPIGVLSKTSFLCHTVRDGQCVRIDFRKTITERAGVDPGVVVPEIGAFDLISYPDPVHDGLVLLFHGEIDRPEPGSNGSLQTSLHLAFRPRIIADQPYGITEIHPIQKAVRKYPMGDWMTSEQWFEEVRRPFTALSFVDLVDADNPDRGLLIVHDGSQQWFLDEEENAVRCVLNMYDPWDEDYFQGSVRANFLLVPHGPMRNSQRWKIAQEFLRPVSRAFFACEDAGDRLESKFGALEVMPENVIPTAFYREEESFASKGLTNYAGKGMGHPFILRLVEFDGIETEAHLNIVGPVAKAYKTNLMGEVERELVVEEDSADENGWPRAKIKVPMRPFEIATLYLDIIPGRKQTRDLDAKREVWATVHRQDKP